MDAGADVEVCGNAQVTLTASGANSYEWYLSSDLTSPLSTNNPYQFNWPFINNNSRSYTVVGTNNNGCSASDEVTVTRVNTSLVDAGTYNNVCIGTPVSLNGTGTGTFNWSSSGDGNFDDNTSLTAVYTPGTNDNTNGNVTLTLDVDQGSPCGVVSDNVTINYNTTFGNNSVAINPSSPTVNDDLTADINTTSCVDVSTNDWRLGGTSIAIRNYSFNRDEGNTITDYSTHSNNGTVTNTVDWVSTGKTGGARDFNGGFIVAGSDAMNGDFTFSAWINPAK